MSSKPVNKNDINLILKRALNTIRTFKEQAHGYAYEPIAIVGMACRFPGGSDTPDKFWEFLKSGEDGITEIPADRFNINEYYDPNPNSLDKMYLREAGFLRENIKTFDARFFGISPREVQDMDPQHRILLELSWEALERAGMAPSRFKNSRTGVFLGLIGSEYGLLPRNKDAIGPYSLLGCLPNIASGRISHFFGFQGPAITLDTACSSSLVSMHLACESLQRRECDMALAGGASLMLAPTPFILLCKIQALAKDGRSKAFDASADGYGRGEGGGIIVLKRLADAQNNNDPILAVIKGSAVNQDGHSSGLTVPNGAAQQELLKDTLKKAGLNPEDIGYFEAHGTGTPLGDPIEVQAINEIYGQKRRQSPLYLGTVKANIGHLEAAAGIAAVIKSVLCLQNKMIPPHLYTKTLNPRINLERIPAILPKKLEPWDSVDKPRVVAMSSFGFSGTNAHVIMSEYVARGKQKSSNALENELQILTLSAYDNTALKALAKEYLDYSTDHSEAKIADICYTTNTGRASFPNRVAFLAQNKNQLQEHINEFLRDQAKVEYVFQHQIILGSTPKIVFLFGGEEEGINFGKYTLLYKNQPVFRDAIDACSELFEPYLDGSSLNDFSQASRSAEKPYLFAIEYALSQLWASWGIMPSAVSGEKLGNYVLACVAGVMSLQKAVQCIMQTGDQKRELEMNDLSPPRMSIVSNKTGKFMKKSEVIEPSYWQNQSSGSSNFDASIQTLYQQGYTIFVAIGRDNTLLDKARECLAGKEVQYVASQDEEDLFEVLIQGLAKLYCYGANINWDQFYSTSAYTKLVLPTYPFQRKPYWLAPYKEITPVNPVGENKNPLIGHQIESPLQQKQIIFQLSRENIPDVKDTNNVLHIGYMTEIILNAIKKCFGTLVFTALGGEESSVYLTLIAGKVKTVYIIMTPLQHDIIDIAIYARDSETMPWILYIKSKIRLGEQFDFTQIKLPAIDLLKNQCKTTYSGVTFYDKLRKKGLDLGPSVQWVDAVWSNDHEAVIRFKPIKKVKMDIQQTWSLPVPPGLLDACLQAYNAALPGLLDDNNIYMLSRLGKLNFANNIEVGEELLCYITIKKHNEKTASGTASFYIIDNENRVIAQCEDFEMKAINATSEGVSDIELQRPDLVKNLIEASPEKRLKILENYIQDTLASLLGMEAGDLSIDEPLKYSGIDSLIALTLTSKLHSDLGIDISVETVIEGPSIKELVAGFPTITYKQ